MAEGFAAVDYVTNLRLSEVGSKRLWLVRVPRHMESTRLEGTKLKLPLRKSREGKVLGRAAPGDESDGDNGIAEREAFVLRAADAAESRGFRALFSTEEDDKLAPACLFAGQVNVSVESSIESHASEEGREGDKLKVPTAALVEPYQGRPQLKGMRVRAKLAGAGSEYTRPRPSADRELPAPATSGAAVKREEEEKKVVTNEASEGVAGPPHPETPKTSKKKKKRKSVAADGAVKPVKEEWKEGSASTTKKPKKKNRSRLGV